MNTGPLRISFVLPHLNICGGVRSTLELAEGLHDRGHRVRVIYPLVPHSGGSLLNPRLQFYRFHQFLRNVKRGNGVEWFSNRMPISRVLAIREAFLPDSDVLIATWWQDAFRISSMSESKGIKVHFVRSYETWGGPPDLVRESYRLPLKKLVTSRFLHQVMIDMDQEVLGVVPNGVSRDLLFPERDRRAGNGPARIGLMYREAEWKGMKDGLESLNMTQREFPEMIPVLFGEQVLPRHREMVNRLKNVEYHHLPSGAELRRIYNSLDIFLFPSREEGFGRPPMEAMSCGCALVSTRVGAVPEYATNGHDSLLCEPGDPEAMRDALVSLLRDPQMRLTLSENALETSVGFGWERSVSRMEELLHSLRPEN